MKKIAIYGLFILILIGFLDATYLTIEHYSNAIPPCTIHSILSDCGRVLRSPYALIGPIPLAVIGMVQYSLLFVWVIKRHARLAILQSIIGFLASVYFVYLQLFVIRAICLYCFVSALVSTLIFVICITLFPKERKRITAAIVYFLYTQILKRLLFTADPEKVHVRICRFGETLGSTKIAQELIHVLFEMSHPTLQQNIAGLYFPTPIGLAAGFDYEARLTQALHPWGFGFQSVGTITKESYIGNPRPMLGRLPKSKSLMVNKGFKNFGAVKTIKRLSGINFAIPVGISIGRTNTKKRLTQKQSVRDIVKTFQLFKASSVDNAYFELNISCPNLYGNISFYPPKNLDELLTQIDRIGIKKPILIKMPIEKSNVEVLAMLKVIAKHKIVGVIFGNLQKDRTNPAFVDNELTPFKTGGFSGKPTFDRSNELISLVYKHYKKRFVIIGCGGVFSAADAWEKIIRGASLVQLITGMIYEGPQLISQINYGLEDLLAKNGFKHISEAVGTKK
jgi:dihydroorotate dehydrogenase